MSDQVKENVEGNLCDYSSQLTNIPFVEIQPAEEKLGSISFTLCSLLDIWHRQTCWDIIGGENNNANCMCWDIIGGENNNANCMFF